jgi:type I restriction enzyme M protein
MPSKRDVVSLLKRDELLAVVDRFGLEPPDRRSKDGLAETVAASRKATLEEILGGFKRERLKELCRALGLDDSGREKAEIVGRLAGSRATASRAVSDRADEPEEREQEAEDVSEPGPVAEPEKPKRGKGKKASRNGTGNGGIMDLVKELWQAAVTLRGSIEPADYKRYVLPIIFLRFLSLRFERRRAELQRKIDDPKSDYHGYTAALEDPDEYRSANTFMVPTEARWRRIVDEVARRDDVKLQLDRVLKVLEDTYPDKLRGLLPPVYAGSNLDAENLRGLINLFSKDVFAADMGGEDVIGRVYEYFIGEFASSEGKRGGEYFTPSSIVRTLVAMLEPSLGKVFDPCCGSGGMFVQSDRFTSHSGKLSFYGQESKDFTYRLCRMNLFIHGVDGDIRLGNSYFADQHETLKADYLLANPPFNDGSKAENGWGADRIPDKDPRLDLGAVDDEGRKRKVPLADKNANTMWILHFLHHLAPGGTAGFVMATGELSNSEIARLEVRKALVDLDFVDCVVQLTGQLFAQTQIPCALWFLSRNRDGSHGCRKRKGEILFIDGRNLGALIPGSRKQKFLSDEEVEKIASVYRTFKRTGRPDDVPGFCGVATTETVEGNRYALTPGRYVGGEIEGDDDEPFGKKIKRLSSALLKQFDEAERLRSVIVENLKGLGYGD